MENRPLFKKGEQSDLSNYREVHLLNTTLKLVTKILMKKIRSHLEISNEQQDRRRSHNDTTFIIRQVASHWNIISQVFSSS